MGHSEIYSRLRKTVGVLITISGITHLSQYWVYKSEHGAMATTAVVTGLVLLILGPSILLRQSRCLLWFAFILHSVVAAPHIYRLFFMSNTPITIFHFTVVCLVVPACAYLLFSTADQISEHDR